MVLVGHSYGGVVVSEAFAPDRGESVSSLITNPPASAPVPPILPPVDGYLFLDRDKFAASLPARLPVPMEPENLP